ncbi:MAG TPA: DUF3455 domain-containing protein [Polyangiaceae bacterium]
MITSKLPTLVRTAFALSSLVALAGCTITSQEPTASQSTSLSSKCPPSVPSDLAVPDGNKLAFYLDAIGVQIYVCTSNASGYSWTFKAPEAKLLNAGGQLAGTHYAGPTWEANDGTKVVGSRVAGFLADPRAIPWLLLRAVSHQGDDGRMVKVSFIQRLDTSGGTAPITGCDADHIGTIASIDYAATYFFYEESAAQDQNCD